MEYFEEGGHGTWDAQALPLLNATAFAATYLVHGRVPIGMPFHAEVSLMQGIEVPVETPEQRRFAAMFVPPAATWILLAGECIHGLCANDHSRQDGAPGSTPNDVRWLWGKGRGYSLERWAFWRARFGDIAQAGDLSGEIREIAKRAAEAMDGCGN